MADYNGVTIPQLPTKELSTTDYFIITDTNGASGKALASDLMNQVSEQINDEIQDIQAVVDDIYDQFANKDEIGTYNATTNVATIRNTAGADVTFTPTTTPTVANGKSFRVEVAGTQSITGTSKAMAVGGSIISRAGVKWDYTSPPISLAQTLGLSTSQGSSQKLTTDTFNPIKWGNLNVSGYNKMADAFGAITYYEWDSKSGAQAANFSVVKLSDTLANTVSVQMITTGAFTDAAPQAVFTGGTAKRFAFTSSDEFKISLSTNLANPSVLYYEYLDASGTAIVQFLYAQLNEGETKTITTSNSNVKYIQLVSAIFSYTANTGSAVPFNFSGASSSIFTMGIFVKGRSVEKTLLTELAELHTNINTNTSEISSLKNNAGSSCLDQISKGLYRFFNTCTVDSGANISASFDGNNPRFSKKSVRISVSGVTPINNDSANYRGNISVTLDSVTVTKSMSFWLKVPSDYLFSSPRVGETSKVSFAQLDIDFYDGTTLVRSKTIYPEYDIVPGWAFHKFYSTDFVGLTITKVILKVKTYDKNPNMTFWVNSLVIDQMAIPTLTISSDNDWDSRTYASGWPTYVQNNNIPLSLRIYLDSTSGSAAGRWLAKQLYDSGQLDMGVYSGKARGNTPTLPDTPLTTYSSIVDYLKNDSQNGRLYALNRGFPKRDLIESQNAINYLDDMLMVAEREAGFRIFRNSNSQAMTGYIDDLSPVIPCRQYGSFSSIGAINETLITNQINAGKLLIDRCIAYGSFGCMLVHQVVTQAQAISGDENLASLYEVMTGIMDYAITKVASGELRLITNSGLYNSCTNN